MDGMGWVEVWWGGRGGEGVGRYPRLKVLGAGDGGKKGDGEGEWERKKR